MNVSAEQYALATAAAGLFPMPLLDTVLQNEIRVRMVRQLMAEHGVSLTNEQVSELAVEPIIGENAVGRLLWWSVKKLLRKVFWFVGLFYIRADYQATLALRDTVLATGSVPAEGLVA